MNARHGAKDAPGRVNGALAREPFLITGAWRRLIVQPSQIGNWKKATVIGAETAGWMTTSVEELWYLDLANSLLEWRQIRAIARFHARPPFLFGLAGFLEDFRLGFAAVVAFGTWLWNRAMSQAAAGPGGVSAR